MQLEHQEVKDARTVEVGHDGLGGVVDDREHLQRPHSPCQVALDVAGVLQQHCCDYVAGDLQAIWVPKLGPWQLCTQQALEGAALFMTSAKTAVGSGDPHRPRS